MHRTNFLIIGSGIAGLNFALHASKKGSVTILTKKKVAESNTNYAQGGIAGVIDKIDSEHKHIQDTLKAGSYHNKRKAVKFMVSHGKEAITRLIELGVAFEKGLTREGGHSSKRISYIGDYTGQEIERILIKRVRQHPNIEIIENAFATDLLTQKTLTKTRAYGASYIKNNKLDYVFADAVILATGGVGQLFQYTTNPEIATGDGISMAIRAGATTHDLEFIQFHPTALKKRRTPLFLLSEALRGEGATLVNDKHERFMQKYSSKKELASRDIVARAIYQESLKNPIFLDITTKTTSKTAPQLKKRFPKIAQELRRHKLNLAHDLIPVTPAVHYICGGIKTDLKGRTSIKGLYAFGECAYTGVHGANRLASNSLLEAFVFSNQVADNLKPAKTAKIISTPNFKITKSKPLQIKAQQTRKTLRKIMWEHCGIVRTRESLTEGLKAIRTLQQKFNTSIPDQETSRQIIETQNMLILAEKILISAKRRRKSIGTHFIAQ